MAVARAAGRITIDFRYLAEELSVRERPNAFAKTWRVCGGGEASVLQNHVVREQFDPRGDVRLCCSFVRGAGSLPGGDDFLWCWHFVRPIR